MRMTNNSTFHNGTDCGMIRQAFTSRVLPVLYSLILLGSLVLNGIAAWIFFKISSRKSIVVFLKNIVIADLVMTTTFPFTILSHAEVAPDIINQIVCRFSAIVFYNCMYISLILLTLISFDRYLKIVRVSTTSIFQTAKFAKTASVMIWMIMFLQAMPNMILNKNDMKLKSRKDCMKLKIQPLGEKWHYFVVYFTMSIFWVTFVLMVVFYTYILKAIYKSHKKFKKEPSDGHRKSRRNIFSILGVFFVCFVPYHISRIPFTASQSGNKFSCTTGNFLFFFKEGALLLSAMNTCLDPILYFLLCKSFTAALCREIRSLQNKKQMNEQVDLSENKLKSTVATTDSF
ncbi:P2Y purinoceptor 14-like isoform X2 [Protopterus annectens]|nr:P2Y purinoceptor 14-like isoform X2 [Protopterus annectens]